VETKAEAVSPAKKNADDKNIQIKIPEKMGRPRGRPPKTPRTPIKTSAATDGASNISSAKKAKTPKEKSTPKSVLKEPIEPVDTSNESTAMEVDGEGVTKETETFDVGTIKFHVPDIRLPEEFVGKFVVVKSDEEPFFIAKVTKASGRKNVRIRWWDKNKTTLQYAPLLSEQVISIDTFHGIVDKPPKGDEIDLLADILGQLEHSNAPTADLEEIVQAVTD
jgi:hypothetical protein